MVGDFLQTVFPSQYLHIPETSRFAKFYEDDVELQKNDLLVFLGVHSTQSTQLIETRQGQTLSTSSKTEEGSSMAMAIMMMMTTTTMMMVTTTTMMMTY